MNNNFKIIRAILLMELAFLLLWVIIEGVYTKAIFAYLILFGGYLVIFQKTTPQNIRRIEGVLVCICLIFANTFIVSLVLMEIADFFYSNKNAISRLGLTYKSLIWNGYSLFYTSIIVGLFSLILLLFLRIVRK